MAIYQRGKSWYYDFVHKGQRYTGRIGPVSRTIAKEEETRKKAEVIEGQLNPAKTRKSPRFEAFAPEYLEWIKANKKPLTFVRVTRALTHLTTCFGMQQLNEITAWDIERYKKARKDAGMAPATINLELTFLKALLYKAQAWGKLTEHPGKSVKRLKAPDGKIRFLSEEEEAAILAVAPPALRRIVQAGLLTGFRRQELVTLRSEDVDFVRGTVTVAACYSKNGESRTIPMGKRLRAVLQDARSAGVESPTVFTKDNGKPWTVSGFSNAFGRACQQAGLEILYPHVLRHTFASRLVMAGVDLRTVQELMGHKTITMTLRYAHLSPDHKRKAVETLEARFSAKSPINFHNTLPTTPPHGETKLVAIH